MCGYNMKIQNLKREYISGIYDTKAFLIKEKPFILQSGQKSHLYLNHRNFLSINKYLILLATIYHKLSSHIKSEYRLGAVDSITSPIIVGAMCALFNKDYVVIRSEPLKHGTQEYIYGSVDLPIILIDDMTSTGGTLIDAAEKIRDNGGYVDHAIISAYRDKTAINRLKSSGIETLAIAGFDEILLEINDLLTDEEKQIVNNERGFHS